LIWLKRLLPLILIGLGWLGYTQYQEYRVRRFYDDAERYALVTAQVWLASAKYRDHQQQFLSFRDSLLEAAGLSPEKIDEYLRRYAARPETYTPYLRLVKKYVDSLSGSSADTPDDSLPLEPVDSTMIE